MTTLREAAQRALKSLEHAIKEWTDEMEFRSCIDVSDEWLESADTLREALAQPDDHIEDHLEMVQPAPEPVAWMDREGDIYRMPEIKNWAPPHTFLYTTPPQHPTETEAEYGSEADTEELLRIGAMPEPLRLAAMLEKTMQWPLHGIAADCLRRMHNEAQRKPIIGEPK